MNEFCTQHTHTHTYNKHTYLYVQILDTDVSCLAWRERCARVSVALAWLLLLLWASWCLRNFSTSSKLLADNRLFTICKRVHMYGIYNIDLKLYDLANVYKYVCGMRYFGTLTHSHSRRLLLFGQLTLRVVTIISRCR